MGREQGGESVGPDLSLVGGGISLCFDSAIRPDALARLTVLLLNMLELIQGKKMFVNSITQKGDQNAEIP
jgi:hypothetical protein